MHFEDHSSMFKLIPSSSDPLEASIQILRVCVFVCLCIMEVKYLRDRTGLVRHNIIAMVATNS